MGTVRRRAAQNKVDQERYLWLKNIIVNIVMALPQTTSEAIVGLAEVQDSGTHIIVHFIITVNRFKTLCLLVQMDLYISAVFLALWAAQTERVMSQNGTAAHGRR